MSRYPHPYAQHCDSRCGCCTNQADPTGPAFLMPETEKEEDGGRDE